MNREERHMVAMKLMSIRDKYLEELLCLTEEKTGYSFGAFRYSLQTTNLIKFIEEFIHQNELFDTNDILVKYEEEHNRFDPTHQLVQKLVSEKDGGDV